MSDQLTALVRTVVATVAGSVAAFLVKHGFDIDSGAISALLFPLCIGLYQLLAGWIQRRWPNVLTLHLFGVAKLPVYVPSKAPEVVVEDHAVTVETSSVAVTAQQGQPEVVEVPERPEPEPAPVPLPQRFPATSVQARNPTGFRAP